MHLGIAWLIFICIFGAGLVWILVDESRLSVSRIKKDPDLSKKEVERYRQRAVYFFMLAVLSAILTIITLLLLFT